MTEESDVFLEGAGLLGSPFSVGSDPPYLLKGNMVNKENPKMFFKCGKVFHHFCIPAFKIPGVAI